ncbi:hypothetical protein SAMN04488077_11951 [Roseovarius tolerans]|uniref:Uncharacterized protein n=1 Tax=Roseovarius tolerans TaxID=74031 RepID=A0A1H8H951_9RHOB|nr:hypothetical protein [Roseovarius tolerans]SEN52645.1 hypothetical protein SAMN04488077_11951 [Roseovarius tolerans]
MTSRQVLVGLHHEGLGRMVAKCRSSCGAAAGEAKRPEPGEQQHKAGGQGIGAAACVIEKLIGATGTLPGGWIRLRLAKVSVVNVGLFSV